MVDLNKINIKFGTSGLRGLSSDFSPDVCHMFVTSFIKTIKDRYNFSNIAIGIDNRPSSPDIARYCISAIYSQGINVDYCGVLPTPALAYYSFQNKIPCIMITGSHIPFDRNGMKFYLPDGEISKGDEQAIIDNVNKHVTLNIITDLPHPNESAILTYIKRYTSFFPSDLLRGKRIGIYEHSSAGRDIYNKLFSALGAETISLGRSDCFVPIDTEAVSLEDQVKARCWAREFKLDAIFSTDGDGDRPLVADNNGQWIKGDVLGFLCSVALDVDAIVVPINCNSMIGKVGTLISVTRTRIGSPYVLDGINRLKKTGNIVAGFEANGGYILSSTICKNGRVLEHLATRDALLPALAVLSLAYQNYRNINELLVTLPKIYTASDRIQDVSNEFNTLYVDNIKKEPKKYFERIGVEGSIIDINMLDGIRVVFNDNKIIHIRPSGNAPELRCYCESDSLKHAESFVQKVLNDAKFLSGISMSL
ncbi:TPA: phosphomannomutase [Escherichia coli]|nr:phosphomannomutase [Escherichia coli]